MKTHTGGPAFPHEYKFGDGTAKRADGMTLRDYFAAKAAAAWISRSEWDASADDSFFASMAYDIADAMLEARK
jgi:hypothetical protein